MPLDKSDDMGDWIKDFYKSDAPQFKGKSKDKRRQMAIAAKLSAENALMKDSNIMLSEKRAFILAARKAFVDGKKSFVFKEKTYPCTIKEETNLFSELTDLLITKKEQFGKVVEATDDSTGDNVDDGDAPSPDIEDDELKGAANMAKQRYQKFGYEDSDVTGKALPENEIEGLKKFNIKKIKLLRAVKAKIRGHKYAIEDLMRMASEKDIIKMYKKDPVKFNFMITKMYPQNREKLDKEDFTVDGVLIKNSYDQEDTGIQESVEYHDRESMPSAVDDAADVMSSYTKFLKSTKSYN